MSIKKNKYTLAEWVLTLPVGKFLFWFYSALLIEFVLSMSLLLLYLRHRTEL